MVARRLHLLEQVGMQLQTQYGIEYRAVGLDMSDSNFIQQLEAATADLDVGLVISNAGTPTPGAFLSMDREILLKGVQLKVVGHLKMAHHFAARLVQRGRGGLLLVSSTGGLQGIPYVANNAAMEAYVLSLGEALHLELKPAGIEVTVLLPGPTDTPALRAMGFDPADLPMKPMSAAQCAAEGLAALSAGRATHIAGRLNRWMNALLPRSVATRVNGKMIGKVFASGKSS
jgi:short-subunit dehydrogenase